jgi:hypothetical protein
MDHPDAAELLYVLQNRYWTIGCCKIVIVIFRQAGKEKSADSLLALQNRYWRGLNA